MSIDEFKNEVDDLRVRVGIVLLVLAVVVALTAGVVVMLQR